MRTKNIILLAVIACIGVVAFFFACKYSYESKLSALKEEAKEAFIKAFNQELKSRNVEGEGPLMLTLPDVSNVGFTELPDSVIYADSTGVYKLKLDKAKHYDNITTDTSVRLLHSVAFKEHPIQPDSLNLIWKKYLNESGISMEAALYVSVVDRLGDVTSASTSYACEIEVMAYLHYSVWNMLYMEIILGLLIYIVCIYMIYKFILFVQNKIFSIRKKEVIEKPVIKIVKEMEKVVLK